MRGREIDWAVRLTRCIDTLLRTDASCPEIATPLTEIVACVLDLAVVRDFDPYERVLGVNEVTEEQTAEGWESHDTLVTFRG